MKRKHAYKRPSVDTALIIHRIVEEHGAEKGYSRSILEACLDFPFIDTHGYIPYGDIFSKAAALMYAIITFHPFTDGNKRTALLLTSLFLALNGYQFNYPPDTVKKTIAIAKGELSIQDIAKWIRENSIKKRESLSS